MGRSTQALLAENPQICYALLHAECLAGMVASPVRTKDIQNRRAICCRTLPTPKPSALTKGPAARGGARAAAAAGAPRLPALPRTLLDAPRLAASPCRAAAGAARRGGSPAACGGGPALAPHSAGSVGGWRRTLSHRGNLVCAVEAETLWAVRVLRGASRPNGRLDPRGRGALGWPPGGTNMDLLWAWLRALQENSTPGRPGLRVDPRMAEKAAVRNTDPGRLVGAMNVGHSFKIPWPWDPARPTGDGPGEELGLDRYVKAHGRRPRRGARPRQVRQGSSRGLVRPAGRSEAAAAGERDAEARARWYFQRRGRIIMPEAGPLESPTQTPSSHEKITTGGFS
ncbi:unnamed protein product [Prorocentrum cordatum]|uniref:Uncharacterized protein n=1 Tax=Prorocentrum cordatum TaxID=2364126 RepID=A0ABN9RS61_9DINO|nr:unnamed protein product [Polarella glacialis]